MKTEVSLVIPCYNEISNLKKNFLKIKKAIEKITKNYEIIIAEDGSKDGTAELAEEYSNKYKKVKHFHSDVRLGRGRALNLAFKKTKGNILIYMDSDLATNIKHMAQLIKKIKNGADFATGSRYAKGADLKRNLKREIASRTFNFLVRFLLHSKIKDHQCGFKAFKKSSLMKIIDDIEDRHWFWDTECLVRAQKKGFQVIEFPVKWRESKTSKVKVSGDSINMGSKLFRLWLKLK